MALKVMMKELRSLLGDPRSMLLTLAAPFLFRFFLPGFDGGAFLAILVAYVVLALFSTRADGASIKTGMRQFPVTYRDHVLGLFLLQAVAVAAAALVAWAFVQVSGPQDFMEGIIPKALGLCLALTGLLILLGLWLRPEIARVVGMVLTILVLNFFIFEPARGPVFMPAIGSLQALLLGFGAWCAFLALGLLLQPQQ